MSEIDRLRKNVFDNLQEIERLNNIIDELEKYLQEKIKYMETHSIERMVAYDDSLYKLKKLKGE